MQVVSPSILDFTSPRRYPSYCLVSDFIGVPLALSQPPGATGDELPSLFKHKVAFYLSRFCSVGFIQPLACHLYSQGMGTSQIYELIATPLPSSLDEIKEHTEVLASRSSPLTSWPSHDSALEKALFWCSIFCYMQSSPSTMELIALLKKSLSNCLYISLSSLYSLIASTQKWIEFNPECVPKVEASIMQHVMMDPPLNDFLSNYVSKVLAQTNNYTHRQKEIVTKYEELIKTLTENKELAEASSASKSQFLANMSHEIRQPMNGVLGMARLLKQTMLTEEQWDYVKSISQSGETLLNIINDILDVSKIEKNMLQLEHAAFDVRECLSDTLATFNVPAHQKRIQLSSFIDPSVPSVVIQDKSRVSQVLFNLLGNAVKFTGDAGHVEVTLKRSKIQEDGGEGEGGEVVVLEFCISDTGCGITDSFKKRLFEPFCQFFNSSRGGGTGLGLAISQNLIRLMKGKIWVESEPNKGSQFYFTISAGRAEGTQTPQLSPLSEHSPRDSMFTTPIPETKYKILVVDDDPINLRVMTKMLSKLGQDNLQTAETGSEALLCIEESDFDIIFMDVYLGEMDGMEVTRRIHKNLSITQRARPAIIAVSASAFSEDRDKCLNAGMQDFLPKPVKLEEVANLIQQWGKKT